MKFFVAFALLAAVASASIIPPAVVASENPEIQQIVAAIQSPSTDPATAAALEEILLDILGIPKPEPIQVGPAIVDDYEPISVGPAIVDDYEPISIGPEIVDFPVPETAFEPSPAMPSPGAPSTAPLVQIILNINKAALDMPGSPVVVEGLPSAPPPPTPVQVVDVAEGSESINVVDMPAILPEPVIVAEPSYVPEPVIVVEDAAAPETVQVAQPIIPVPAIVLPDTLN